MTYSSLAIDDPRSTVGYEVEWPIIIQAQDPTDFPYRCYLTEDNSSPVNFYMELGSADPAYWNSYTLTPPSTTCYGDSDFFSSYFVEYYLARGTEQVESPLDQVLYYDENQFNSGFPAYLFTDPGFRAYTL